jgi:hypothetical protein
LGFFEHGFLCRKINLVFLVTKFEFDEIKLI